MRIQRDIAPKSLAGLGAHSKTHPSENDYHKLGTACYCTYLRYKNVQSACATCLKFDRVIREAELRQMVVSRGLHRVDQKHFESLRARCALTGITLYATDDYRGHTMFVASRWALTRIFESVEEVDTWLCRVSGKVAEQVAQS